MHVCPALRYQRLEGVRWRSGRPLSSLRPVSLFSCDGARPTHLVPSPRLPYVTCHGLLPDPHLANAHWVTRPVALRLGASDRMDRKSHTPASSPQQIGVNPPGQRCYSIRSPCTKSHLHPSRKPAQSA
eukprot:356154-Chlamydomonas_euryale.AAC.7